MAESDTPKTQSRSKRFSVTKTLSPSSSSTTGTPTRTNPLIDRILANPLVFKPGSKKESSSSQSPTKGFIVLSAQAKARQTQAADSKSTDLTAVTANTTASHKQDPMALSNQSSPRKPKSMAEAVAAYTGKKFLTRKEKRLEKLKIKQQLELQRKLQLELESSANITNDETDINKDDGDDDTPTPLLPFTKFDSESSIDISSRSTSPERRRKVDSDSDVGVSEEQLPELELEEDSSSSSSNDDEDEDADYAISASEDEDDEEEEEEDDDDDDDDDSSDHSSSGSNSRSGSASPQVENTKKRAKIGFEDDDMNIKTLKNVLKLDRYENGQDNRSLSKSASPEINNNREGEDAEDEDEEYEDGTSPIDGPKKLGTTPPTSPEDESDGAIKPNEDCQQVKQKSLDTSLEGFYDLNLNPNDHGSNGSTRIIKHWREYSDRKPWGLLNEGVTCYMNSAIQAFVHIPAMQHYLNQIFTGKLGKEHKEKSNVTYTLAELSNSMWNPKLRSKQHPYIYPKRMIHRLHQINCMMSQWQQEDSHEYFMSLMSRLQEDLTPKGHKLNESIIYEIFGGLLNQKITCLKCQGVSETKQEFYDLSLGLNKKKSHPYLLEKSLTDFFSNELIKTDKKDKLTGYYCSKCEMNTNANKISTIDISPEYLTIHLKRFKFDGNALSKLKQSISYPNYLDLTKYQTEDQQMPLSLKYKLMSVIVHEGRNVTLGHYVAHCLQPDGTWATYDDEYINKIAQEQALSDPAAYVLVYGKLTAKGYKNHNNQKRMGSQMANNGVAKKKRKQ
ncbi:uncharacterized protein KQ657_005144 [Scheffersomyces spartinae]|uniref:ubiquitinyl hydrolase 1 n=1 Tax=Scheffersomyces spartinae TaxID=45513 RepID=A0A9P7VA08_9ASCO|nr:uncharacterized protein KQ657_005144 [Scheffersomyces spartinae]KAG7193945.1 hypothetical protein KQ657_005144 [Scheffersomyces spartinae]